MERVAPFMNQIQQFFQRLRSLLPAVFLGGVSVFVVLELLLRIWSGIYVMKFTYTKPETEGEFVILVLGESTTAGDTADIWPAQLEHLLRNTYPSRSIRVVNKAVPGTNTSTLVGNLSEQIESVRPDMIVSMMGINDEYDASLRLSQYVPTRQSDRLMVVRFFRIVSRQFSGALEDLYDFTIERRRETIVGKAEEHRRDGEYELAQRYYHRAIAIAPDEAGSYLALATLYMSMQRRQEAERMFFIAREVAPASEIVFTEFGNFYRDTGRFEPAERMYQKALALNPEYGYVYGEYATLKYWYETDGAAAIPLYERAIALYPELIANYFELADLYQGQQRNEDAVSLYRRVLQLEPDNSLALRLLAKIGVDAGEVAGIAVVAGETARGYLHPATQNSYRKLLTLADAHNIPVIAVQYPLRSVEPLADHINGEMAGIRIPVHVVGNEENFTKALTTLRYDDLFTDYFGGNFGHATREGNRLIAENVASAVEALIGASEIE